VLAPPGLARQNAFGGKLPLARGGRAQKNIIAMLRLAEELQAPALSDQPPETPPGTLHEIAHRVFADLANAAEADVVAVKQAVREAVPLLDESEPFNALRLHRARLRTPDAVVFGAATTRVDGPDFFVEVRADGSVRELGTHTHPLTRSLWTM
jgi:hypothetical protein